MKATAYLMDPNLTSVAFLYPLFGQIGSCFSLFSLESLHARACLATTVSRHISSTLALYDIDRRTHVHISGDSKRAHAHIYIPYHTIPYTLSLSPPPSVLRWLLYIHCSIFSSLFLDPYLALWHCIALHSIVTGGRPGLGHNFLVLFFFTFPSVLGRKYTHTGHRSP
ncbi:hypothetical protein B0T22DRAFT_100250 [Podospora appendiculata]|uniref:Uncharacterized protein n=1 Tax=Podospora appendiculata TaxID=314037 RepID=A0AAE0XKN2_9PEZI|nr:hypothetical protein B0T22DRAFT_100250 [Podospora appendiculata]